jgi:hypothetical protein
MSIFGVFKSKWSAKLMSEDDRRKLFWYLKRTSSYTAWKARAEAFDRFAAVVEHQVRDEPVAMGNWKDPAWATNWENFYTEILKGQVLYEQGLKRLREGDRSVWRYNDRGCAPGRVERPRALVDSSGKSRAPRRRFLRRQIRPGDDSGHR